MTLAALLAACASRSVPSEPAPVSEVRFLNQDPVWLVDDRRAVPEKPAARELDRLDVFDIAVTDRVDRAFEKPRRWRALGTNSLDEVPDSTWFENRIGVREVAPEEVGHDRGPDRSARLAVVEVEASGFVVADAAGARWHVTLEPSGVAAASAAAVVSQRLLWLVGYRVPDHHTGTITRDDLVGGEELDAMLARTTARDDGSYRVLFRRVPGGEPIGPTPQRGVRRDDPNDTIPHERRRELRGLHVFAAWLQHTGFTETSTLDVWDGVVVHYLVDVADTLGLSAANVREDDGHVEKALDADHVKSLLSLGLWRRPWEGVREPDIPGVGAFDVDHFDPGGFTPFSPYQPFLAADERDMRWAVRLLLRITPAHLRAALEAARFDDPRAVDYLAEVLVGRQRATARHWLARVSPLDDANLLGDRLCLTDLAVAHELASGGLTTYGAAAYDYHARPLGGVLVRTGPGGRVCAIDVPEGAAEDGYTIVRLDVARDERRLPPIEVHLARGPGGRRIVGIERP